ncbi:hypothetical protein B0H17DRAFT_1038088 [Mycena rosella]|uniref:FAD-binding PCMH-type domain-containing protein n=1 Tax=Mycena rosella TaxID=1033263 RepID=A0AAD7GUH4_MYCRO|nr:hypothetical protein B0H17DRAFT_1038088 [Mycena rosella]
MKSFTTSLVLLFCALFGNSEKAQENTTCRNIPGTAGYPSPDLWDALNATISGRLVNVVPSTKYCASLPGGGWYDLTPPSLCLRNATTCGQGDVPIYSVEAETVADIQAAVQFASTHNLRLVVKSSGHDYLGRSTAPHSLLVHTVNFKNISFADAFFVGKRNVGSAVTVGSGVHVQSLYQAGKQNGKIVVSGCHNSAGHSALSPTFGLASDNALEFNVVVASGDLLRVNIFYALRGGGSGSWDIIISATLRIFPTFNATSSLIILLALNNAAAASLATVHAQHIFDMDSVRAGQYFFLFKHSTEASTLSVLALNSYMPNTTTAQSTAILAPFLNASLALPDVQLISQQFVDGDIDDALFQADDSVGENTVLGSRLIPAGTYRDSPAKVGQVYKQLLDSGTVIVLSNSWTDCATLREIDAIRKQFKTQQLPILENISGPNAGSYSNEADVLEAEFKTTFFGPNYAKLSAIKRRYDPKDLFIVPAGVGSDRWDEWGLCQL